MELTRIHCWWVQCDCGPGISPSSCAEVRYRLAAEKLAWTAGREQVLCHSTAAEVEGYHYCCIARAQLWSTVIGFALTSGHGDMRVHDDY